MRGVSGGVICVMGGDIYVCDGPWTWPADIGICVNMLCRRWHGECCDLSGLDYYLAVTLKDQYIQIGDAVPPVMAYLPVSVLCVL